MSNDESNVEKIQDDEKLAIAAIFGDDAKFAEWKWKNWHPLEVTIHLEPIATSSRDENRRKIAVDVHITCSKEYPWRIPSFGVRNVVGFSQDVANQLIDRLKQKAAQLVGNVMILDICNEARDFLGTIDSKPALSFHDNMIKMQADAAVETTRKRLDSDRRELELVAEEQEKIAIERQLRNQGALEKENRLEGELRMIGGRRIVVLSNIPLKRKRIHPMCQEWMGSFENEQLLISEWSFRYTLGRNPNETKKRDFGPFLKRLEEVADELNALCQFQKPDPNLVEYSFIHVHKFSTTITNFVVKVFVAQKIYPDEENMQDVCHAVATNSSLIRRLAAQAVCGLRFLHEQQLAHSALRMPSVWLRENVFRFSDFGTLAAITELCTFFNEISSGKRTEELARSDENEKPRKKDLFQLGTLLDELLRTARGSNYSRVPTPDNGQSEDNCLPRFIKKCQAAKNIDQLVDDSFLNHETPLSGSDNLFTSFGGSMDQHCRVMKEFLLITMLGKGGFGDVILARHRLDSMDYALKRIPLTPGNERLNRRIKKEAKLFAKLNHPNVVRYFSAWEEDLNALSDHNDSGDESLGAVPIPGKVAKKRNSGGKKVAIAIPDEKDDDDWNNSLLPPNLREIEREAAAAVRSRSRKIVKETSEWSTSYRVKGDSRSSSSSSSNEPDGVGRKSAGLNHSSTNRVQTLFSPKNVAIPDDDLSIFWEESDEHEEEEEDDEDETEESAYGRYSTANTDATESVDIVFENGDSEVKNESKIVEIDEKSIETPHFKTPIIRRPKVLIIQMEYCEKGTLRQCIDDGLFVNDAENIWRIFSEILSGLQYMHNQGVIHRDIKPMNIFLNSQQSVKIGDFGLATKELNKYRKKAADKSASIEAVTERKSADTGADQTRDIGTQMYMAPELCDEDTQLQKTRYSSKVDVYSTGVVLFEMFYRPLPVGMERMSTLTALKNELKIPDDFGANFSATQTLAARKTIEWMLKRNPDERPSVEELLNDDSLPKNREEDEHFKKQFLRVLKKKNGTMHKWVLDAQFDEDVSLSANYLYDVEICKERFMLMRDRHIEKLCFELTDILKSHFYEPVQTHTLVTAATARSSQPVRFKPTEILNKTGTPLALPTDLRQNFVRYCLRNAVNRLKRYNFGRVYWFDESSTHPQERWECSVDSIGPGAASASLEAELIMTACQLLARTVQGLKLVLRIGHVGLIEAVIRHLKINDELRGIVLEKLHMFSTMDKVPSQAERVEQLGKFIGKKTAASLLSNLPCETSLAKFRESCRHLLKSRVVDIQETTEKILGELEMIQEIMSYGRTRSRIAFYDELTGSVEEIARVNVVFDAQTSYRPKTFGDGLVFQVVIEVPTKKGATKSIGVLAGGRYDSALLREQHPRDYAPPVPRCLVGFAISMDVVAEIRRRVPNATNSAPAPCKTMICSMTQADNNLLLAEKFRLAKKLWDMNLVADVLHEPVTHPENLNEHCEKKEISHMLVVCNSIPEILVRCHNSNYGKMDMEKAVATVCRDGAATTPILQCQAPAGDAPHEEMPTPLSASRSVSSSYILTASTTKGASGATSANLNITLGMAERVGLKEKKRIETQVRTHLADTFSMFNPRSRIEVIVTDLSKELIKAIVGDVSRNCSVDEVSTVFEQLGRQNHRQSVELDALCHQLNAIMKQVATSPINHQMSAGAIIVIYRHSDNFYRFMT
ncbi:unnamed protein product [Caenorhabditis bovis]|uniref:non-specific serine/threonine protein kinase n=1 Tax=Caenorhabditis bovis TaxID=2654633 RepID=A0A8S1ESI6_9PELO|nr:unnamed protein product [Caenorhabditis bovis]